MTFKVLTVSAVLTCLPAMTFAKGCQNHGPAQSVSQCAEGEIMDSTTGTCQPLVSS